MYTRLPLLLLLLPLAVLAQDDTSASTTRSASGSQTSASATGSQSGSTTSGSATTRAPVTTVITSTAISEFTTVSNGQTRTGNTTRVFTTTSVVQETTAAASTTSRSTSTRPLSTAPTGVDGGGGGVDGAPLPGATGQNGVYGPDDNYIAAAGSLQKNGLLVGLVGAAVGAALTLM